MDRQELLEELKANPKKVHFVRLCKIAAALGFRTRKGTGSHRVYFQDEGGWAKAYQVRQFIKVIEKYGLHED